MDHLTMDADELQSRLYALGRKSAALAKAGVCDHGWFKGPAVDEPQNGPAKCLHCSKEFASVADLLNERRTALA